MNDFQWIQEMAEAGANQYTFHIEATSDPMNCIRRIKEAKMKVSHCIYGITLYHHRHHHPNSDSIPITLSLK